MLTKTLASTLTLLCATVFCHAQTETEKKRAEITAMSNVRSCRSGSYLANGKEIVFISDMSGSPQIWKIPAEGGWPIQLTAFNDPVAAVAPSPKTDLIAFSLAPGGGLNTQIFLMKSDGSEVRQITKGGKTNNNVGVWSHDGSLLSLRSNEQNEDGIDSFIYDVKKGTYELAIKNKGILGSLIVICGH